MSNKLSDDFMKTNSDYVKLKSSEPAGSTPRENPNQQSPGYRGLQRPDLEQWTTGELRHSVATLNLEEDIDGLSRDALVARLLDSGRGHAGRG